MDKENIILNEISVNGPLVYYRFSVTGGIKRYFRTDTLFIEFDRDVSDLPESILTIPFVGSFIAFAWIADAVLWVREIDKTFYDSIPKIKRAYQEIYDHYHLKGRFAPAIIKRNKIEEFQCSNKAVLLFSGGADCQATLIRNLSKKPMLCNIQGWYESLDSEDAAADADKRDISSFALENHLPTCFIRSNFAIAIDNKRFDHKFKEQLGDTWWHGFLHSMAFISIAIPIAFQSGIYEILIASSLTIGLNFYCASNLTTDSEFCFATDGFTTHDGFELNRQDKAHIIVEHQKSTGKPFFLRVCSFNDHNCCECEKCFRSILGIIAEGGDIKDFGFIINKPLKEHWTDVIYRKGGLMSFASERLIHWPHIKKRMKENYDNIQDKEFVDWFMSFDFDKAQRESRRRYYRQNFFSILKRKLHL